MTGGHKSVESLSVNFFNKLCLMKFIGWENILYLVWVSLSNCMFVLSYYNGIEKDSCFPNPCQHGGDCSVSGSSFDCSCAVGWKGERCEGAKLWQLT